MAEQNLSKSKNKEEFLKYWISYCPFCGKIVDHQEMKQKQTSLCLVCEQDLNTPFQKKKKDFKAILICEKCEQLNPPRVSFCWNCGSIELVIDEFRAKIISRKKRKLLFFKSKGFLFILSFIISVGISLGLILGIASKYIIAKSWVFVVITISFSLILTWFIFVIIGYIVTKK